MTMDLIIENSELIIEVGIILLSLLGGGSAVALKILPALKVAKTINNLLIKNIETHHPERNDQIKIDIKTEAIFEDVQGNLRQKVIELT